jgi:hypothetical protein
MMQHPAIIALLVSSLTISGMMLYAGWYGTRIIEKWDLNSGSELQLNLERQTYLISTILSYTLVFQILSLFLFIYTADNLHGLFTGAMCAAGTLNVNSEGYPTLILKIVTCILAGVWLILNYADNRGYDYPLIKVKYTLLQILAVLVLVETSLQFEFFSQLRGDVITSCCGSLFSVERPGITGDIAALPPGIMEPAFFAGMALTVILGLIFYLKGRGGYLFSVMSSLTFIIAVISLISFICLYYYELPSHHCPFCILQKEYGYVGYLLYATLLGGGVAGLGTGVLMPFRNRGSMSRVIPQLQRRLVATALVLYLAFTLMVTYRVVFTSFRLSE